MPFLFLCFSGFILVFVVPLAWLQDNIPRLRSSAKFLSEENNPNLTNNVYGFVNDLAKRSTTDNRKRILPPRRLDSNPTAVFHKSTPSLHELLFQNHATQASVSNKNEPTTTSSRTMKEKQADYSSAKTSQGLDAITKGAVLQLALITGPEDKEKKLSLVHNTHPKLLLEGSSAVFDSSVVSPTRLVFYCLLSSRFSSHTFWPKLAILFIKFSKLKKKTIIGSMNDIS